MAQLSLSLPRSTYRRAPSRSKETRLTLIIRFLLNSFMACFLAIALRNDLASTFSTPLIPYCLKIPLIAVFLSFTRTLIVLCSIDGTNLLFEGCNLFVYNSLWRFRYVAYYPISKCACDCFGLVISLAYR